MSQIAIIDPLRVFIGYFQSGLVDIYRIPDHPVLLFFPFAWMETGPSFSTDCNDIIVEWCYRCGGQRTIQGIMEMILIQERRY
jgi:hypothetical protein